MILEAFARYLESKNLGEVGVDLFCYYMPPKVPRGIMVMTPNDGILIDPELKGYYQDIFPVMIRAENINLLNNLSERVLKEMDARDFEVDGVYFNFIRAVTFPSIYPQNNGGSFEAGFVVEFSCYFSSE